MKTKVVALNLLLAAGVVGVVWEARSRMNEADEVRRSHLDAPVKRVTPPPVAPVREPAASSALKYEDVAKKNLFSPDRNDDIVIDPPKVEAPKPMPALPIMFGVMTLPSGTKASMAEKKGEGSRMVRAGDKIGEFQIVALDAKDVTFDWNGKQIQKKVEDLIDRSNGDSAAGQQSAAAGPAVAPPPAPAAQSANKPPGEADLGKELTPTTRACQGRDASAVGSVVDGYRKEATMSPFGPINCRWVKQ